MNLSDIVHRSPNPAPWSEGDNIPWNDPEFSERMLREHLSQEHDAASRRTEKIENQIEWIHQQVLEGQPTRILDLGCGPGLYASRLARLGHECVGIDFSPASIAYAKAEAERDQLRCTYHHADIRHADFGSGYGLVMLIFGEFNVFKPADARAILHKAYEALLPGGKLLLEPHTYKKIKEMGGESAAWFSAETGLFSAKPHLGLSESCWDDSLHTTTNRYFIIDAATGEITRYAASYQGYSNEEYVNVLMECGFEEAVIYPTLGDSKDNYDLMGIIARKRI